MNEQNKKVPTVRFKGFTNDWEQRKLGEISTSFSGGTPSVKNKSYYGGKIPFIRSAEIHKNKTELFITESGLKNSSAKLIKKGTLLYALYGATSGEVDVSNIDGAINQAIMAIFLQKDNVSFIKYYLEKNKDKIIAKYLQGGQGNLSASIIKSVHINLPFTEEQLKISNLIKKVESLITLQQRKLALLKQLKKGLLQKMFADKDSKQPILRFKGFHDDWEQRKLVSLFSKFTDGDWIESKDQANTGIRLIQTGNIGITEFINKFGNEKWISEETFKKLNCEEIFPGDIIISRLPDPAGRACILPKLDTRMITAVDCTIARTSREASAEFIVQYLSTQTYFKYVQSCLAGGTRQRISRKNLANFNVSIPTEINEQKQIGFFFKQLDTLIALHQRKQNHLKLLKKSLLQQMFM